MTPTLDAASRPVTGVSEFQQEVCGSSFAEEGAKRKTTTERS